MDMYKWAHCGLSAGRIAYNPLSSQPTNFGWYTIYAKKVYIKMDSFNHTRNLYKVGICHFGNTYT